MPLGSGGFLRLGDPFVYKMVFLANHLDTTGGSILFTLFYQPRSRHGSLAACQMNTAPLSSLDLVRLRVCRDRDKSSHALNGSRSRIRDLCNKHCSRKDEFVKLLRQERAQIPVSVGDWKGDIL